MKKYNIQLYELDKATGKTKLKSLFDIFSQLKANDASIQDLTRLFDKIGGNAANNVFAELMKLPELIQNSVYAAGLSDRIASEKQETIKGKWDKVTSQFTETGMNVFEAYSPVIKEGLDNLVLYSQDAQGYSIRIDRNNRRLDQCVHMGIKKLVLAGTFCSWRRIIKEDIKYSSLHNLHDKRSS